MFEQEEENMISKVETLTVADAVAEKLLGYISTGNLVWGQQLPPQRELAKQLNVGISSVREALQILQAIGYVEVKRGQGTYITENPSVPLTKSLTRSMYQDVNIRDLMEVREVLDTGIAVLSAKKAEPADIERMDRCLTALEESCESDQLKAVKSDLEFHIALAESVKNPLLEQFYRAIRNSYEKFLVDVSHSQAGARLHRNVLNAIEQEDPLGARDAMIDLLKHTRQIYLKEHFNRGKHEEGSD